MKMKKTYQRPITECVTVMIEKRLLAGSTTQVEVSNENYNEVTMTDLSRTGWNIWDEE